MTASDVLRILDVFAAAGIRVWIGGGWGVDALVGRQTRQHQDLDLMFDRELEREVVKHLAAAGFAETLDWRPGRFVMSDGTRDLDLHPVEFLSDGSAALHTHDGGRFHYPTGSFVTGTIVGEEVPCLRASLQWEFHQGYKPTEKDLHDLSLLEGLLER